MVQEDIIYCGETAAVNLLEPFEESEKNEYINELFAGLITLTTLSHIYHRKVKRNLSEPIKTNIGAGDAVRRDISEAMEKNVSEFSAGKQYQMAREMLEAKKDVSFDDFKREASAIFEKYNDNYL